MKEARTAARLQHPNIVQVYDVGIDEGVCYIVLEYVRGRTLEQVLTQESPGSLLIATLLEQIGEGLHHAHESGFVHRDIKPANILLDNEDRPKVSDFGLARVVEGDTFATTTCGTPGYVAPEILSDKPYKEPCDFWSLGVVLFIMLSGEPPFTTMITLSFLK